MPAPLYRVEYAYPLGQEVIDRVVALIATEPPHAATHWTAAAMARAVGISVSSVQRIWRAHGLAPHRLRPFKLSNDPDFVPKLREIVGLYVNPLAHAVAGRNASPRRVSTVSCATRPARRDSHTYPVAPCDNRDLERSGRRASIVAW
jgi:hypothetical protein